ncbi:ATP-binding protein [Nostoc sp. 'Peltigera membranacea cyanobiont' 232]|uniref:ATP-binding protein n=1 Tax=Nostoc sp. 'Peltigera membranacea cyanobiont' 232 TaxID=2014531 RepID=UPI000B955124|nr:ATP-binding protein [Nostoc sp. 'Peltigera membranacea cyanobiont' 232]OYE02931.1 AAA family ATPase [Nostoc sp. 'Peltigera membranacea cyanobiont' 232]
MSNLDSWMPNNEEYLANALAWLRWRLRKFAQLPDTEIADVTEKPTAEEMNPLPALLLLSQKLGLSDFEQEILLLCVAMELDPGMARLCAKAQDNAHQPYPTFALALSLFDEPTWDALSWERPLRYWRLIEIYQLGVQPLTSSGLRVDERILNYIKGLNSLSDRLASLVIPLETEEWDVKLPPSQNAVVETIIQQLRQTQREQRLPVIQLVGADSLSKQLIAQQVAAQLDRYVYRLSVELLPTQAGELETVARLWHRESLLLPLALYLDAQELDDKPTTEGQALPLHRFLTRSGGLIFLSTREIRQNLGQSTIVVDVEKPTPTEQKATWSKALGIVADISPRLLTGQFNLNLVTIEQIAQQVLAETPNLEIPNRLWSACLGNARPQLDTLAQRLDLKATWDDIVLAPEETNLLHQIADQIRQRSQVYQNWGFDKRMNRGMGISALFAGESGTGKTMAAEVIANDLQLNLYRIDLSAVVNKYIGETEKNLRRLFDAAENGGAILFFDEADALFGKRSEVRDSHDRHANIEVNYLLQRLEAYRGLAILATNLKSSLDHAFMRRLRFIVNFSFPGIAERQVMWEKVFPPETPTEDLDFRRLARLNLTGASIQNVALNAAFLAAQAGTPVTIALVLAAVRTEFRKLDRPVNEADFRVSVLTGVTV